MSKYRILKINERHQVQKRNIFGNWKYLEDFFWYLDALNYVAKINPNYRPTKEEIVFECD
jgi:hypothetical protein